MNPKQYFESLEKKSFPMFTRGDIIFTNTHKSWFARLIRFKGKLEGEDPLCNHVEMYLLEGHSIGANKKVDIKNIKKYFGGKHDVYLWHDTSLSGEDRDKLISEVLRYLDKPYDYTSIIWQALDGITFSTFFSRTFNKSFLVYCSELIQRVYWRALKKKISTKKIGAATPYNIYSYLEKKNNWKSMFSLFKQNGKWIITT